MNGTPTFTQFNFQSEEELGFGMFDVPSATNHHHHGFHQSIHPAAYPEPFPLNTPNTPLDHIPPQNNVFGFIPRSLVATYADHTQPPTPYPHTKLESPALSSGSSSTPDTHESQRLITPKNTSGLRHVSEDRDDDDDYDDDGSMPLMGPGGRMGKQKARQQQDPGEYEGRDGKRKHFLQRNRVAAMKCRKKKKEWVNDLEETKTGLESHNAHLHMELDGLVDEASRIRAQLMVHANCNDSNIDKWIENEAKRFVIGTGERYDQILAHFSPAQGVGVGVDPQQQQQQQQQDMSSAAPGSEYTTGGPSLISPLTTPSHIPLTPHGASPAFFTPNTSSMNTPRCYPMPAQEAPPYMTHGDVPPPHEEPDYDGMPIALYDHQVG